MAYTPHIRVEEPAPTPSAVQAVSRLAFARKQHPDLIKSEAKARVQLAAAIIAMDEAADVPGRHNLQEQASVNVALQVYGQTLADLLRGESLHEQPSRHPRA